MAWWPDHLSPMSRVSFALPDFGALLECIWIPSGRIALPRVRVLTCDAEIP
eukprot:m.469591 g.469591  ORF g.469591 m.469591 type:complete len:51 (+) comp28780_c0_seq1:917-1069(+)